MNKLKIKTDDMVVVVAGKRTRDDYEGTPRKVLKVLRKGRKVVVESHRTMKKHIRPNKNNPKGGRIEKEAAIDISNVKLYCPNTECPSQKTKRGVRVGYEERDGQKIRFCRKCNEEI